MNLRLLLLVMCFIPSSRTAHAFTSETVQHGANRYTVVRVDPKSENLQLFLDDDTQKPFSRFDRLADWLAARGQTLAFAMNAGMYEKDYSAVGLYVAGGKEAAPLNSKPGNGNFYLQPNGVFFIDSYGAAIVETADYASTPRTPRLATQSGPMLVHGGKINGLFDPQSTSRNRRNGAGIAATGEVVFAISEQPVNFHEFALLFLDDLRCNEALYFDGTVSGLYMPALQRNDHRYPLGPILGVVQ